MKDFIITSLKKIKSSIERNKLVVFVGAGVSKSSGLPNWIDLISTLRIDLGIKEDNAINSFLKIPQIYYNERGQKEYNDKINELLNKQVFPNQIHESIHKLKPAHIITTNFDNLLEKSCDLLNINYHKISANEHLPYAQFDKMIIKMHGDFDKNNFVLKEDDYRNYSKNFNLIEAYIKALFSTHLILFVGFSATDPNFKNIFESVKDILSDDFQRSYLLDCSKVYDRLEFDYYKNKGINILFYSEISEEIESYFKNFPDDYKSLSTFNIINDDIGGRLNKFLLYIYTYSNLPYHISYNKKGSYDFINYIYESLKMFDNYNVIWPNNVINSVDKYNSFLIYSGHSFRLFGAKEKEEILPLISHKNWESAIRYWKILKPDIKIKIKFILKILRKALIHVIFIDNPNGPYFQYRLEPKPYEKFFSKHKELLFYFNYKELDFFLKSDIPNLPFNGNEMKYLEYAFLYHKIGKNIDAFNLYKKISQLSFDNKNYFFYYISEFNKKKLEISFLNMQFQDEYKLESLTKYIEELKTINLDNIYNNLPNDIKDKLLFVKQLFNYQLINELISNSVDYDERIHSIKQIIERGGYADGGSYFSLTEDCYRFWNFITQNNLIVEDYDSIIKRYFKNVIKGVFRSHSIDLTKSKILNEHYVLRKIDTLHYFWLYLTIINFDDRELIDIMDKIGIIELHIDSKTKKDLIEAFNNLIESYIYFNFQSTKIKLYNYIRNSIFLFSYISFTQTENEEIIAIIIKLLNSNPLSIEYSPIYRFIIKQYHFEKNNLSVNILEILLIDILTIRNL
ncbi:MAG: hypothetical protein A2220_00040 [Ignavibacteria bacterium RIFOXYA2_FULL_35_10]|nr:MAG: hypothetical protein A2220_00040 [Ignavibacteria bacterium RIFOXYA2_FULL_35_10]